MEKTYTLPWKYINKDYLCFTANTAGSTVELYKVGSPDISNTAYSRDLLTWTTFTPSTTIGTNRITLTNIGDKVYFRNDINANFSSSNYLRFNLTGSIAASGNCNSIYTKTNFINLKTLTYTYCYNKFFLYCTSLTTAPELPATTLSDFCYSQMFDGCTNLIATPKLPATNIAPYCYMLMFTLCDTITTAPDLPATTMYIQCYDRMFQGCDRLTTAMTTLPATTLASSCYWGMFSECPLLTSIPTLPATTLANQCYQSMFNSCSALINAAIVLPATTLVSECYRNMFYNCTLLTSAPELKAIILADLSCFRMFENCTSLNVSQSTGEHKIFTCPTFTTGSPVSSMFLNTGGSYTSDPVANETYYYN